jgi:hypothetical protein
MKYLSILRILSCLLVLLFLSKYAKADKPFKILFVDANCSNDRDLLFSSIDNIVKDHNFLFFFSRQESPIILSNYNDFNRCFESGGDCRGNFPSISYRDDCFYFFNYLANHKYNEDIKLLSLTPDNLISSNLNIEFFFFIDIEKCVLNESSALDLFVYNFYELLLDKKDSQVLAKVFFDKNKFKVVEEGEPLISQQLERFKATTKILYETF